MPPIGFGRGCGGILKIVAEQFGYLCMSRKINLTRERARFEIEFMKARNRGAKIYLMVEAPSGYNDIIEHNYQTRFDPISYMGNLRARENRFDCYVQFMEQQHNGYYIASTFFYYAWELFM